MVKTIWALPPMKNRGSGYPLQVLTTDRSGSGLSATILNAGPILILFLRQQGSFGQKRAERAGRCAGKGIAIFAEAGPRSERQQGKRLRPVVLPACAQRP